MCGRISRLHERMVFRKSFGTECTRLQTKVRSRGRCGVSQDVETQNITVSKNLHVSFVYVNINQDNKNTPFFNSGDGKKLKIKT